MRARPAYVMAYTVSHYLLNVGQMSGYFARVDNSHTHSFRSCMKLKRPTGSPMHTRSWVMEVNPCLILIIGVV